MLLFGVWLSSLDIDLIKLQRLLSSHPRVRDKGGSTSPKEVVAEIIHRLELHAYHSTLEVLYASGPLSWEHEELLTNLRISLHISNDEHLMEIKNLVSSGRNF